MQKYYQQRTGNVICILQNTDKNEQMKFLTRCDICDTCSYKWHFLKTGETQKITKYNGELFRMLFTAIDSKILFFWKDTKYWMLIIYQIFSAPNMYADKNSITALSLL